MRPSLSVAVSGKGASRRHDEDVERTGRTVLAYVRGGASVAAGGPSSHGSVCQSRPTGAVEEDHKSVVLSFVECPLWVVECRSGPVTGEGEQRVRWCQHRRLRTKVASIVERRWCCCCRCRQRGRRSHQRR